MPEQTLDEVLAHYGVLGMKWGVRRSDKQIRNARLKRKEKGKPVTPVSEDVKRARAAAAKITKDGDLSSLSNQELNTVLNRMQLEQRYSQLTSSEAKKGSSAVQKLLKVQKTVNQANSFAKSPPGKMISKAIMKSLVVDFKDMKL